MSTELELDAARFNVPPKHWRRILRLLRSKTAAQRPLIEQVLTIGRAYVVRDALVGMFLVEVRTGAVAPVRSVSVELWCSREEVNEVVEAATLSGAEVVRTAEVGDA